MNCGQISLDFLFAVIAGLIVLSSLTAVSGQMANMQAASSARQQLHAIGLNLASFLSATDILGDAENGSTVAGYEVPLIAVPGESRPQACRIAAAGNELTLSYDVVDAKTGDSETIEEKVPFRFPASMALSPDITDTGTPAKCGETITVARAS